MMRTYASANGALARQKPASRRESAAVSRMCPLGKLGNCTQIERQSRPVIAAGDPSHEAVGPAPVRSARSTGAVHAAIGVTAPA
jgi:hypothetical protein